MKIILNLALWFILLTAGPALHAQEKVFVGAALQKEYFGDKVYIFKDHSANRTFNSVKDSSALFQPSNYKVPNLGASSDNNWIRFSLVNNTSLNSVILSISNPIIDEATLYLVRANKTDSIKYSNDKPLRNRVYKHQFYLFDIPMQKGEVIDCYLMMRSNQQILAPLSLKTETTIVSSVSKSDIRTGLYLGIMMVMLFYNLFIYFTTRDRDYIVYCHYIFWVALTQATLLGFSHRFLWPDNVWLSRNMVIICGAMSGIATILFAKSFLKTRSFVPRLNILLNVTIAVYSVAIVLLLTGNQSTAFNVVNATAAFVSLLIIFVAGSVYRKNYAPATYFLVSWSIFFASILVFVSKDYNLVPYNQFTVHSVEIGSALEAIFLSFALAGKINILKKEKEASQAEALRIAKENERIIREQNAILEARVNERTHELKESNEELNATLSDLKQTQSQLVESEKMASLGQLTAGIAHEINNPINFVTSNVTPLKRDFNILWEAVETIESIAVAEGQSIDDKQKQIEEYKEDLDFPYLKTEIEYLLKGIHEGASRTAEIVKGLRIFSRLDEDDLKKADINQGIESTLIIVNNLFNGKIQVIKELGDIPMIECYPGKLNQVFLNIITNAIHAIKLKNPESGGELQISTSCNADNVFVRIKDNGIGMDENTQRKIFEPFFTTKDVGEGTGLGMSIAYNTIRKHNGVIHLESTPGVGTEFVLELPILHEIIETL